VPDLSIAQPLRLRSLWLAAGWLLVFLVVYLSLRPGGALLPETFIDKLQHVIAYAVLMYWFAGLYALRPVRACYATGFIALGIALEFIQLWSGYRSFDPGDMVADAVGVAAGWLLAPPRTPPMLEAVERIMFKLTTGRSG